MIANNLMSAEPVHPGEMIKDEIEFRGLTQKQLAVEMGMSPSLLNEILNGRRRVSTEYALLGEDMAKAYERLKVVYDAIGVSTIKDYQVVSKDLKITTFANGAKVYVNYGETDTTYNGVKVPAVDFVVVGGDK